MNVATAPAGNTVCCYHCGAEVPHGAPWRIELEELNHPLCCPGCEAVAHAIVEGGLESYYRFRTELPERPSDRDIQRADTWAVFDDPELQREFVHSAGDDGHRQVTLAVDGITCAACAWLIEHRLNALDGLESSAVNLSHHRLHVVWDPDRLKLSRILAELAAIGYPSQPYEPDQAQQKLQHEERQAIRRLIVAAVAMMQVMMFSIPLYVAGPDGMSEGFHTLFHWLSLALATPVVAFSALPFFRNALRDLRTRHLGMDVPVSLAILCAYLASAYAVLSGSGEVYFDSVTMFTFFLLFSRYIEMRARRRNGHSGNALSGVLPSSAVRVETDGSERILPANQLRPGDRVRVRPGHGIPADGVIVAGHSSLDESMLTGEPLPVSREIGETVTGGSLNVESVLEIEVTHAGRDARAAGILELTDRAFASRPRIAEQASRMAHHFVLRLLIVTLGVIVAWSFIDPSRVLWVTLSVLVVTCPCALALATPTALTACHGQMRRRGVLVTRAHAIEGLSQATRVVFDKTGTLTEGHMRLQETQLIADTLDANQAGRLAAALEAHSEHPIARAFHELRDPSLRANDVRNHTGQGLEGDIDGQHYRLGRPGFALAASPLPPARTGQWLLLSRGDSIEHAEPLAWFRLDDFLREDARETVAALREAGLTVELLSGDGRTTVETLANEVGITTWTAEATPESKLAHVQALQAAGERVVMIGDGINDVPVLAAADVSVAMNGATDLARTRADAVLMSPRLWRIVEAMTLARLTRRLIRQNLGWALCYNLCALPLAAMGLVPPWAAALGMSASSLIVVGNALRLNRSRLPAPNPMPMNAS
ncbi:cadmium-translocating P-type ATPase [Halomonas sp. McH1-25]|uniref:heavy metal translocating P-type ATPase n=1 Tax=unclassified Halomonas TaxID=2609666 RepID=UPI001EF61780|nr:MULTISPECIES: heavy metal translocating P-type ATPase [unclassified Halomonas]MCG7600704.1 cadmium-translocating P-type ATPase [Halomonas sp. McH1-25]MCP1341282.1 heavy metal translocating P-type ATPase [Halomonas sp. FL8]MCP1361825.1 heavy metal translocating P-type ATPase [Halomonas sp. BBD45]MCP1364523.1 heavy metal translocating P-type ATPase [Halomonas sp. BBD48]